MPTQRVPSHPVRKRSPADEHLLDRLRKICMALPEAIEKLSVMGSKEATDYFLELLK